MISPLHNPNTDQDMPTYPVPELEVFPHAEHAGQLVADLAKPADIGQLGTPQGAVFYLDTEGAGVSLRVQGFHPTHGLYTLLESRPSTGPGTFAYIVHPGIPAVSADASHTIARSQVTCQFLSRSFRVIADSSEPVTYGVRAQLLR